MLSFPSDLTHKTKSGTWFRFLFGSSYRWFEGGALTLNSFKYRVPDRVIYWGQFVFIQRAVNNYGVAMPASFSVA